MDSGSLLFFNIPYVFALCIIFLTTGVNGGLSTSNTSHTINEVHSPRRYLKSNAQPTALAKGKRVALLQVHFEGNVGDQMETIPLLQKLNEWGVEVDCYLSVWMSQENRLDPHVKERVAPYVKNIYVEGIVFDSQIRAGNYDLLIVTPGPTVNELQHCITAYKAPKGVIIPPEQQRNISMAWFGVTITGWAERTYEKQQNCVKLIAVREEVSLKKIEKVEKKMEQSSNVILSGDISFSYPYEKAALTKLANDKYKNLFKGRWKDWVLIFSRENNFGEGKGVWIKDEKVYIQSIDEKIIEYNIDKVVFASSSDLEDHNHMVRLQAILKSKMRTVTCSTVEEMFALVSSAPHVVTDRYHPGIASLIAGTKLSLTKYPLESTKMHGLRGMMQYTRKQIMGMNQKAFTALLKVLLESKREPLGGSVEDEESNVVSANTAKKRGEEDQSWFAEMGVGGG